MRAPIVYLVGAGPGAPGLITVKGRECIAAADVLIYDYLAAPSLLKQSSVFNTDVQIFSDIGAPCILMMEDYDMMRTGYHDTHDTIENIDLDYASALSAICFETIARAAVLPSEY